MVVLGGGAVSYERGTPVDGHEQCGGGSLQKQQSRHSGGPLGPLGLGP
jgi:hypothetical protein